MSTEQTYSAEMLAGLLGLPQPTMQQVEVIEAPMAPVLVVAGAGSGKTETMASRVVWLLANRHVSVDGILGLTFTRKAAGELAARIGKRIAALQDIGILDPAADALFDRPEVSTYNAYANALFRDNALLVGREPDAGGLEDLRERPDQPPDHEREDRHHHQDPAGDEPAGSRLQVAHPGVGGTPRPQAAEDRADA